MTAVNFSPQRPHDSGGVEEVEGVGGSEAADETAGLEGVEEAEGAKIGALPVWMFERNLRLLH